MAKTRPPAGRPNRRGRSGRGGTGPGPAYRPTSTGGGTSHKSSMLDHRPAILIAYALLIAPLCICAWVVGYLLHGYGVI